MPRHSMRNYPATIAVLTDEYIEYRKLLIDQISHVLNNAGYGTLCIAGRELDPVPSFHQDYSVCNAVYDAASAYPVQGVILLSGSLLGNASISKLATLANRFADKPIVSFGLKLDNVPTILIKEDLATQALYEHLLSQRPARKVAFVAGRPNDPYSLAREDCFRETAKRYGHTDDTILSVEGNYSPIDAYDAVTALVHANPDIDIIAAANDSMAESALRAIHACNRRVPEDIMVTGFDDTREATRMYPAISTVRQPLNEASAACAQLMLDIINGKQDSTPDHCIQFDSELVMRGSTASHDATHRSGPDRKDDVIAQLHQDMRGLPPPEGVCIKQMGDALWTTLNNGSDTLENYLDFHLQKVPLTAQSVHWWNNACHQIENASLLLSDKPDNTGRKAVVIAAAAAVRRHIWTISMSMEFEKRRSNNFEANMQLQMSSCVRQSDILDTLGRWLSQTVIKRCFLVRYITPGPTPDARAQLLLAYKDGHDEQPQADCFYTDKILPDSYAAESTVGILIQVPVYAGNDLFGYLLVDPSGLDYLSLHSAAQSIGNAMRNQYLINQLEKQTQHLQTTNEELVKLANFDDLTDLPNRLQFNSSLRSCCQYAIENNKTLALLFIDLDGFKLVNDTLGHRAGDQLLCEVAARLKEATDGHLGKHGFIARLAGDEFTVTLTSFNERADVEIAADAILSSLACPYTISDRTINISASIGMAEYPVDANDVDLLIKHADSAMYRAKEKGKNRSMWYTSELSVVSDTLLQMDNDMRIALVSGDICMHYQPRVDMNSGRLRAVEALMRWTILTPDGRKPRTRPDIFIGIAEKTGFINQLDAFALDESCRQARAWELAGTPLLVAVNVSVMHLQQDGFVETVLNTIARHQLSPHLLELEITESAMMTQVEANVEKLHRLRSYGIQLSIDDFGTGYSSLSYLKQLPVNNLKIDKSFIADIDTLRMRRSADAAIIKSVIALGRSMDFQIIAEGIETEPQRQFLRALGCDEAQGYLFARPSPANVITQLLNPVAPTQRSA